MLKTLGYMVHVSILRIGERAGCLTVVAQSQKQAEHISSQLCKIIRPAMSNPPAFGARIVSLVLNTPELYQEWTEQLRIMANRIIEMRKELFNALTELQTPGTWNHVIDQIGMFSFTGLNGMLAD
jgi:aspartate aminotransferase